MMTTATKTRPLPQLGDFVLVCNPETNYAVGIGDLGEVVAEKLAASYLVVRVANIYLGRSERFLFEPTSLRRIDERIPQGRFPISMDEGRKERMKQEYAILRPSH